MLYMSRLLAVLLFVGVVSSSVNFYIKHRLSGKYIHPHDTDHTIYDNDPLVMYDGYHNKITMTFDITDGEWGYIRNVYTGKRFHPRGGGDDIPDNTDVVLHSDVRPWAHFAFDQVNNRIVHRSSGRFIHPEGGHEYPDNETPIKLHHDVHAAMEFKLVSTSDPNIEVFPYGDAHIIGEWQLVFSVENPLASHTETIKYTIGKSASESTSSTVKFVWEAEASAQFFFAKMSTSTSLTSSIEASSSQTWHAEVSKTDTVTVVAGETVAVWQKHFIGEQLGHKAVHLSNVFADTNSPNIKPDDYANTQYRFI